MTLSPEAIEKAAQMLGSEPEVEAEEVAQQPEAQDDAEPVEPAEQEPQEEVEPEKPKESSKQAEQFQQLAEREREFRKRELSFKKQSEELSKRISEIEKRENWLNNPENLLEILDAKGMTVEQFQRNLLTGKLDVDRPKVDPVLEKQSQLEKELQELKQFREQVRLQQEQAELEQHLNAYRSEIRNSVPQYENLTEWFGDSLDEVVSEAEQAAEAYAQEYDEAPEVAEILSNLNAFYGNKLERVKSKYSKPAATPSEKKQEPKPTGKTLSHNHTRSVAADTKGDDVVSKVMTRNARDVMNERAMEIFKKHGQLL